jgi:hypothetical protein
MFVAAPVASPADDALLYTAVWLGILKASRDKQSIFTSSDQHFWAKFWATLIARLIILGMVGFAAMVTIVDW